MHVNGSTLPGPNIHNHLCPNIQALLSMPPLRKILFLCLYLQVVGLYRLCGSAAVKKELRDAFEQDSAAVCLSEDVYPDINVITGQLAISPLPAHSFQLSPPSWSGGPSEPSSLLSDLIFMSYTCPLLSPTVGPNDPSSFRSQGALTREDLSVHRHPQGLSSRAAYSAHHPAPLPGGAGSHGPRTPKQGFPGS